MKAAVLHAAHEPLTIEDVSLAKPGPRDVLIRTAVAGICHSDLHFADGAYPHPMPCVLGHESAGIVEAVGEDVTYVKPGDPVVTCLSVFCGYCEQCLSGHPSLCQSAEVKLPPGVSRRLSWKSGLMHQFLNLSSYAEQMLVHEHALAKIRPDMPLDRAALIGCGVLTGVGAVFHTAKVEPGSTVAVIGCGGVGLACINGAAIAGAGRIIAVDTLPAKLELAREMGATDLVNATEGDPVKQVRALTGGVGVQYSFECLGAKVTAEQAFRMLGPRGAATIIGMIPVGTKIELHGPDFLAERKIQGSLMGSNRFRTDMPRLIEFYLQGKLKLDHLISGEMKLAQINDGFAALRSGAAVRNLIRFPS
jgi:S-(hydroxymethyl)glutathione dehydrogenase/alcohol dehydrogenase